MVIEQQITGAIITGIKELYGADVAANQVQLQKTKKEFKGHLTLVVFPFLRMSKKSPEQTAQEIGEYLLRHEPLEIPLGTCHVHPSAAVVKDPVHGKEPAFALVHLQTVVGECAVQRCSHAYLRDHLSSNSLESSTTCRVRATSSSVHFSRR